jgi:hypothetical protein
MTFMNTREIGEIRRHTRQDRSNMTAIYGCYVNDNQEIIAQFRQSTGMMSENEGEKYYALFKRVLSGTIGKNLIDICFKTSQVADSDEHRSLMGLRSSVLQDGEVLQAFYQKVVQSKPLDGNYLILIGCDSYDVPFKSKDGEGDSGRSDETYTYLLCAICPVKQTKPTLHYIPEDRIFHDGNITNVVIRSRYTLLELKADKLEKRLKRFLKGIIKVVLDEINAKNGTDYQYTDVEVHFEHIVPTNEQENVQNAKTEAETEQIRLNSILNVATVIGDEETLKAVCDILDLEFDELKDQLEKLNEPQNTMNAMATLEGVVTDEPAAETGTSAIPE